MMSQTKVIKLSGKRAEKDNTYAVVDENDYEILVAMGKWHLNDSGYAVRRHVVDGRKQTIRMHRVVNNTPDDLLTDHKNHDRLDNRKSNLRTVTQKENMGNIKGEKGYCWDSSRDKWLVTYKKKHIGRYGTEDEAKQAYQQAKSGVEKEDKTHPRRKYLPENVLFMKPAAEKGQKPYYIRPLINGERKFFGYFSTPSDAEIALSIVKTTERRIAS